MTSRDYSQGKIYALVNIETGEQYIGSTTDNLKHRFSAHMCQYVNKRLHEDIKTYGEEGFNIELLEAFPCENNKELTKREEYWRLRALDSGSVYNVKRCHRTKEQRNAANKESNARHPETHKRYNRKYWIDNKEKLKVDQKAYYEENKEVLLEKQREHYADNKPEILEKAKVYYQNNKDYIGRKITCECGFIGNAKNLKRHKNTKKHAENLKKNIQNNPAI